MTTELVFDGHSGVALGVRRRRRSLTERGTAGKDPKDIKMSECKDA